jgi:hypothetical protein
LKWAANVVANLVDNDDDGEADDAAVVDFLAHKGRKGHGAALVCGNSRSEEEREGNLRDLSYTYSCQSYKGIFTPPNEEYGSILVRGTLIEEAFHMVHQSGWSKAYPAALGMNDFTTSVVCREAARLQCVEPGWWHPENQCPSGAPFTTTPSPAKSPLQPGDGDCTKPSCDCAEFYRQAATLFMGYSAFTVGTAPYFWYSDYMPRTKDGFLAMASDELISMMENPAYHQPQEPLSGNYNQTGVMGTAERQGEPTGRDFLCEAGPEGKGWGCEGGYVCFLEFFSPLTF